MARFKPVLIQTPEQEQQELKEKIELIRKVSGKSKVQLPKSVKLKTAKIVCDLYSSGEYTIQSCCDAAGISYYTFIMWAQPTLTDDQIATKQWGAGYVPEIAQLYKESVSTNEVNYFKLLKDATRRGLMMRASGMMYEEVEEQKRVDEKGEMKVTAMKVTNKMLVPDVNALIFVSKNVDPDHFSDTTKTEISGKLDVSPLSKMTDAELAEHRKKLIDRMSSPEEH